jgi:hypothetical protein
LLWKTPTTEKKILMTLRRRKNVFFSGASCCGLKSTWRSALSASTTTTIVHVDPCPDSDGLDYCRFSNHPMTKTV